MKKSSVPYVTVGLLLVLLLFSIEVGWAVLEERPVPLSVGFWLLGLIVLFAGSAAILWGVHRLVRWHAAAARWTLLGLAALAAVVRLQRVAGQPIFPSLLVLSVSLGGLVLLRLVSRNRKGFPGVSPSSLIEPRFWGWALCFLLFTSSDTFKVFWIATRSIRPGSLVGLFTILAMGTGLMVALAAGGVFFQRGCRWIWAHRTTLGVIVGFLLLAGAGLWWWQAPDRAPYRFDGERPTVTHTASAPDRPNIILISVDTLRYDDVPPRLSDPFKAPHMRRLRRDSVRFSNHFSPSSWTLPAHASLFTGLNSYRHGAVKRGRPIDPRHVTFPMYLRELGYRTVGLTGGGLMRRELGFARGFQDYREYPFEPDQPYDDFIPGALEVLETLHGIVRTEPFLPRVRVHRYGLTHFEKTVREARTWLNERSHGRPFFLFLHTYEVHDWLRGYPENVDKLIRNRPDLARYVVAERRLPPGRSGLSSAEKNVFRTMLPGRRTPLSFKKSIFTFGVESDTDRERLKETPLAVLSRGRGFSDTETRLLATIVDRRLEAKRHLYRRGIENMDRALGSLMDSLRRKGLYEDSLIVFLSDHGEGFSRDPLVLKHGRRGMDHRGQLHDSLIRVPLWVKLPDNEFSGLQQNVMLQTQDVFPTLFRYLGIRVGGRKPPRSIAIGDTEAKGRSYASGSVRSGRWGRLPTFYVRGPEYKIVAEVVRGEVRRRSFWSVSGDVEQEHRISGSAVPPDRRGRLDRRLNRLLEEYRSRPDPFAARLPTPVPAVEKRLRGLGYM